MPPLSSRAEEVHAALATVRDPEIDETVVALNFIVGTEIEGDTVTISLRLPTFWCAANFVFLMAGDMRDAVLALQWVRHFKFRLVDHFAADEVSRCITDKRPFTEVLPNLAGDGIGDLRRTFDRKAFLMRQGALLEFMRRKGFADEFLVLATIADVRGMADLAGGELADLAGEYLSKREAIGLGMAAEDRISVTAEGEPVALADLSSHLREIRKVTTSARSNGEMCRILMSSQGSRAKAGQ